MCVLMIVSVVCYVSVCAHDSECVCYVSVCAHDSECVCS